MTSIVRTWGSRGDVSVGLGVVDLLAEGGEGLEDAGDCRLDNACGVCTRSIRAAGRVSIGAVASAGPGDGEYSEESPST